MNFSKKKPFIYALVFFICLGTGALLFFKKTFSNIRFFTSPLLSKNTLIYCVGSNPSTWNPQLATDWTTLNIISKNLYNRLVAFDINNPQKIIPDLATSWNVSKDKKTYTFFLRKKVFFHKTAYFKPTQPFQAKDVAFSFLRQKDKTHPYYPIHGGTYPFFYSLNLHKKIKKIRILSPYKMQFQLTDPDPDFLKTLALQFTSILSQEYGSFLLKKHIPQNIDLYPIGTGPFQFLSFSKNQWVRLKANKNYFKAPPRIQTLIFSIIPDPMVRFQKLKKGTCHILSQPLDQDLASIKTDPNLKLIPGPPWNIFYLAFNLKKPFLKNPLLRKAITYALHKEQYIHLVYRDHAHAASTPIPISLLPPPRPPLSYHLKLAKKLIQNLALPKRPLRIWVLPIARAYCPDGKKIGALIQEDLKKIGIRSQLVTYAWTTYLAKSRSQSADYDLIELGWQVDRPSLEAFLSPLLTCASIQTGSNRAHWCDPLFDQFLLKAQKSFLSSQKTYWYQKALLRFQKAMPWVPLAHAIPYRVIRKEVRGYRFSSFSDNLEQVFLRQ